MRIDQFTPSIAPSDGVSQGVLLTQRLLAELGHTGTIHARHIAAGLEGTCAPVATLLERTPPEALIVHHAIGHEDHTALMALPTRRILAYHNVTPAFYFRDPFLRAACAQGRAQLADAILRCEAFYADSTYNARELFALGAHRVEALPLLLTLPARAAPDEEPPPRAPGTLPEVLFVGRVVPNKCQHQLVRLCAHCKHTLGRPFRLTLAGGISDPRYSAALEWLVRRLDVETEVRLTGQVSDAKREALYARADIFVSLSEHEGFCMPAAEAAMRGVAVLAYAAGGLETAVGHQGLFADKRIPVVARRLLRLLDQPRLQASLVRAQWRHVQRFAHAARRQALAGFLRRHGIEAGD